VQGISIGMGEAMKPLRRSERRGGAFFLGNSALGGEAMEVKWR